jgi:thiol-disulfide isomerase/thioredoxin
MNLKNSSILLFSLLLLFACGYIDNSSRLIRQGKWKGILDIHGNQLPFLFEVDYKNDMPVMVIFNGEEEIYVDEIQLTKDSFYIKLPVFDSEFLGVFTSEKLTGKWINNARSDKNIIDFIATYGKQEKFERSVDNSKNISGKYATVFYDAADSLSSAFNAVGEFQYQNQILKGTFLTSTGDFRYLEGVVRGDSVFLAGFNGAMVYLFRGKISNETIEGEYFSGIHSSKKFVAVKNENADLEDANALTKVVSEIKFEFPDLDGNLVKYPDNRFKGKFVILQIMGSWCPNCLDEAAFFQELYENYHENGLEIVALAFENSAEFETAKKNVQRFKTKVGAEYPFLIAGISKKQAASEALPFLDGVKAFPTSIFINKEGKVIKIHTGFSGPGTGKYYEELKKEVEVLVREWL